MSQLKQSLSHGRFSLQYIHEEWNSLRIAHTRIASVDHSRQGGKKYLKMWWFFNLYQCLFVVGMINSIRCRGTFQKYKTVADRRQCCQEPLLPVPQETGCVRS